MSRKALCTAVVLVLLSTLAVGQAPQAQEDYLDVYTVQVKPEKRAEFDALVKKMVTANRQNPVDTWLVVETVYGPGDRVSFISTRHSYGEIEKASDAFMGTIQKAYGKTATEKLFQDYSGCVTNSQSEIRRRRWDLSSAPSDPAAVSRTIGESRWLRTTMVRVRPGQAPAFEALLKELKAARDQATPNQTTLVSQAVAGQQGTVYYLSMLQSSLGGFDGLPTLQKMLGDDAFVKFQKTIAETVEDSQTAINRFNPSLSNAPEEVAAAAPDFWRAKGAGTVNAKAKSAKDATVKAAAKAKEKTN